MNISSKFFRFSLVFTIALALTACAAGPREKPTDRARSAQDLVRSGLAEAPLSAAAPSSIMNLEEPATPDDETADTPPEEVDNRGSIPGIRTVKPEKLPIPGGAREISFNLTSAVDIGSVIEEIADYLGIHAVIDPSITGKTILKTAEGRYLRPEDLWGALQIILLENNISMEKTGNVYHFKRTQDLLPPAIGGPQANLEKSTAGQVLQLTPLRFITAESALMALKPMVEPLGRVISLPTLNVIGIISAPPRLARINTLLDLIDADPFVHRGMRLFRLRNTSAETVVKEIEQILEAVEGDSPTYHLINLERLNAILAIAPPRRGFDEVERWVRILDERNEESGEQIFIYRVRNLEAEKLASTLKEVFEKKDKDEDKKNQRTRNKQDEKRNRRAQADTEEEEAQIPPPEPIASEGGLAVSAELEVSIVADENTNSLIVRARPRDYRQLLETIKMLDRPVKEVMVNVVVAEVTLNDNTRFGIEWSALLGDNNLVGTDELRRGRRTAVTNNFANVAGTGQLVVDYAGNTISALLDLVSSNGNVEVLSRPSLLVRDNQEASMNVGSEQPTVTRQNQTAATTSNNLTTSNEVQYRQVGIILKVKPHINEDGLINMEVSQEVSKVGAPSTELNLPSFDTSKFETSLLVNDGEAIILGGFIKTERNRSLEGIPGLMDAPVVGPLFSAEKDDYTRIELVVIIVPEIIDPLADNRAYMEAFRQRMTAVMAVLNEEPVPVLYRAGFMPSPESPGEPRAPGREPQQDKND